MQRVIGKLALVSLFLALTGCGGSSFPLALAISTSPGTVSGGGTYTFSATTTNSTTQSGVIWSLALNTPSSTTDTTTPCSSPCGTWVNAGTTVTSQTTSGSTTYYNTVTSITYTAPLTPPTPNSIVLTAAAPSNAAITADVIFEVGTPAIVVRLANTFTTIAPGAAPVTLNATVQFDSANAGVNWTLAAGGSPCSPACGTLSPAAAPSFSAVYTPPTILPTAPNNSPTITATSVTSSTSTAFDSFVIQTPPLPISVQITNPFTTVAAGSPGVTVNAQVTNDQQGQGVTWSISPSSSTGSLSANEALSVLYTPPNTAPQPPYNTPTITATSVADPTKSASFTFTIDSSSAAKSACDANGQYAFYLHTTDSAHKPLLVLGSMTLDNGKVMVNSVDVNDNLQIASGSGISGTCSPARLAISFGDASASVITLDAPLPGSEGKTSFRLSLYGDGSMGQAGDVFGNVQPVGVDGILVRQDPGSFTSFGGEFSFILSEPSTSATGRFTLAFNGATGAITNGLMDANATGVGQVVSSGVLTGSATPPDSSGRGTMSLNFAGRVSRAFDYYVVSARQFLLSEMDPNAAFAASGPRAYSPVMARGGGYTQSLSSLTSASINGVRTLVRNSSENMEPITQSRDMASILSISGYSETDAASRITMNYRAKFHSGILLATPSDKRSDIVTFDPATGRATLAYNGGAGRGFVDSAVIYLAAPDVGTFLDTTTGAANHALAGSLTVPTDEGSSQP
jgi:hypothetical protein